MSKLIHGHIHICVFDGILWINLNQHPFCIFTHIFLWQTCPCRSCFLLVLPIRMVTGTSRRSPIGVPPLLWKPPNVCINKHIIDNMNQHESTISKASQSKIIQYMYIYIYLSLTSLYLKYILSDYIRQFCACSAAFAKNTPLRMLSSTDGWSCQQRFAKSCSAAAMVRPHVITINEAQSTQCQVVWNMCFSIHCEFHHPNWLSYFSAWNHQPVASSSLFQVSLW